MRRFHEPFDPSRRYRERPGAYAVIRDGGDVLVTEQMSPRHEFQLPGGGIDAGEGPIRALHRECFEETGWRIAVIRRLGAWQRFSWMPEYRLWAHKVCHVYLARPVRRLGPPSEPGHNAIWMPIRTALDLLAMDGDRAFLAARQPPARSIRSSASLNRARSAGPNGRPRPGRNGSAARRSAIRSRIASRSPTFPAVNAAPSGASARAPRSTQRAASGTSAVTQRSPAPIRSAIQRSAASAPCSTTTTEASGCRDGRMPPFVT